MSAPTSAELFLTAAEPVTTLYYFDDRTGLSGVRLCVEIIGLQKWSSFCYASWSNARVVLEFQFKVFDLEVYLILSVGFEIRGGELSINYK